MTQLRSLTWQQVVLNHVYLICWPHTIVKMQWEFLLVRSQQFVVAGTGWHIHLQAILIVGPLILPLELGSNSLTYRILGKNHSIIVLAFRISYFVLFSYSGASHMQHTQKMEDGLWLEVMMEQKSIQRQQIYNQL